MFYTLALLSMFGWAFQNTLLVRHARKMDGLSLAFYRNVSFFVTLSPLLIGASREDILAVLAFWPHLLLVGMCGGLFLALHFTVYRYIPVGVATSMNRAIVILLVALVSTVYMGESLSNVEVLFICIIASSALLLGWCKNDMDHLKNNVLVGIGIIVLGAIPLLITKQIITVMSREASPLITGYFWEISIAIGAFVVIGLRRLCTGEKLERVSRAQFLDIAACSAFTLVGTGCYTLGVSIGSFAIAEAIGAGGLAVGSLFAWKLYGERLRTTQWLCILLIVFGIAAFKFV